MKLKEINIEEKQKLEKLIQLYLHDISAYFKIDFNSNSCEYLYDLSTYFKNNKAYFIEVNNNIVGFILLDINEDNYEISEIFILNNYKHNHYGEQAITTIFNMYKGNWVIKAVPNSHIAENFWNKVINKYTNNNYKVIKTGKYNRPEYYFNNE
jgi:predicted acetyltransferase